MNKRKWLILVISLILLGGLTFGGGLISELSGLPSAWRILFNIAINLFIGVLAFLSIKLSGGTIDFSWKEKRQYFLGIGISLVLSLAIAWIPALLGTSLVGDHQDFIWWKLIYNLIYYIGIIGPVEELYFRVYLQDTFTGLFHKHKWIGVLIASLIFGFWHLINGSLLQVAFTFGIGAVFGFAKLYLKKLHYPGVALSHGLYDFLNYVVCLTIV